MRKIFDFQFVVGGVNLKDGMVGVVEHYAEEAALKIQLSASFLKDLIRSQAGEYVTYTANGVMTEKGEGNLMTANGVVIKAFSGPLECQIHYDDGSSLFVHWPKHSVAIEMPQPQESWSIAAATPITMVFTRQE